MMEQTDLEIEEPTVKLNICMEFYLRGRIDPLSVFTTFHLATDIFEEIDQKQAFLGALVTENLLEIIDSRGEARFVLSDGQHHKVIVMRDEIQALSISIPEESSIEQALAEVEQEE